MNGYYQILMSESLHLIRSPFKIITLLLFIFAMAYGCKNGYDLFEKQNNEINAISKDNKASINEMIVQYEAIESGDQEKPRRDPTTPYWAIWNTPSYAFKHPSSMMVFSLGQAEQYGYYKRVTNWSSTFDSDLSEEIANPERLAIGTLDFNFVFIYLYPILMIILLFNIGGLEKDLRFSRLIYLQNITNAKWLFARFSFYFIITFLLMVGFTSVSALLTGVLKNELPNFINLLFTILAYILMWFTIFFFINYFGKGSSDQAMKMITIWLALCIVIPGIVHQITSTRYPTNYMTDYLDVSREHSNDIFESSADTLRMILLSSFPNLEHTQFSADTIMDKSIINRSVSGLVNVLNKNVAFKIESLNEDKNEFIKKFNPINPITAFQNQINSIAGTDYYAYHHYRRYIQSIIDEKIDLILKDTWNKKVVNKEKYIEYVTKFN
tara:strand:+ start:130 stop:1446 length:1317 start_codon:yes stop_codon:yes gene_type:complete